MYAGDVGIGINPKLSARVKNSDLLLVVGPRLGEMTTGGYTLINVSKRTQRLIHVCPSTDELGRVYRADLMINSGMRAFARALKNLGTICSGWHLNAREAHQEYIRWTEPPTIPGNVQMGAIMVWIRDNLPPDTIVTNGAGNFSIWCNRFYRYRRYGTLLGPTSGTMGYGLPAAVAASLHCPSNLVVAFAGDGDFMMNCQELATAVQYELNIIVLIINNGMYGTIRMHQERDYPGRVIGTKIVNPNFSALAESFGAHGETVTKTEDFFSAFERAQSIHLPSIIDIQIDPEVILPSATIKNIRGARRERH